MDSCAKNVPFSLNELQANSPKANASISGAMLCTFLVSGLLPASLALAEPSDKIGFDVPAITVAENVEPGLASLPVGSGRLVRIRVPVSVFGLPQFRGQIDECTVELQSPHQSIRVLDFWPRNEVYSNVLGPVHVETSTESRFDTHLKGSAGLEPFARGEAGVGYEKSSSKKERYERMPDVEALISSGTTHRGFGVFFKFSAGATNSVEGAREIAFLAEVPQDWRADLMLVRMHAVGKASQHSYGSSTLASEQMWMTIHQEGDAAAAAQARRFVTQEHSLRTLAASQQDEIRRKSMPTVFHQIGAALDVMEPRIPEDYLTRVLYGPRNQYFQQRDYRLPVDLRVAILDYWDEREALTSLALGLGAQAG